MDYKNTLNKITEDNIIYLLSDLGSKYPKSVPDGLMFQTVCHCGDSHKLHYRRSNKSFYCYSNCGSMMNIFNLVMKAKDCSYEKAYRYVCEKLNIVNSIFDMQGFQEDSDNSFINKFENNKEKYEPLLARDKTILNKFRRLYHHTWLKDYISTDVMKLFDIRFDIQNNAIIIPHYNIDGQLIGIRARNLDETIVESGKKYMPITISDVLYNYPTSMNLYGLHINKENIKKYKHVVIGESEKFVMQHRSFYNDSTAVGLNGSSLSNYHIKLLLSLGVEVIVLALDKEFDNETEEEKYKEKINRSFINKLLQYFRVEIIWDRNSYLGLKDAPSDRGKEIYEKLYAERIILM